MKLTKEYILENSHWPSEITQQILDDYEKARQWDSWPEVREILRNQKLRELIEERQEKWKKASYMTEEEQHTFDELQELLEDSKN